MAFFLRLSLFWTLFLGSLFAREACESPLARIAAIVNQASGRPLQVQKSILERIDEEGLDHIHQWRIAGTEGNSGYLEFREINDSVRGVSSIKINEIYGVAEPLEGGVLRGVGSDLLREVRKEYPHHRISAFMAGTNRDRILRAIEANPFDPDFSDVPAISALNEPYTLNFFYLQALEGPPPLALIEIVREPKPMSTEPVWQNREDFLKAREYRQWLSVGRPVIESNFGKKSHAAK